MDKQIKNNEVKIKKLQKGNPNEGIIGIEALLKNIKINKAKITSSQKACDDINAKLATFLGRKEIIFDVDEKEDGYLIKRKGEAAKNLSEGEKTAIALVYFLVSLKKEGIDLSNAIVFIDDPVSSLDSNSMSQAFAFIKEEIKVTMQIFISTHNYHFFKKVRDWFKDKNKSGTNKSEIYMIKNYLDSNKRKAKIIKIDNLINDYNSEYQYLFKVLKEEADKKEDTELQDLYPLPNMARKFLEIFLAFTIPSKRILNDQLNVLFKKIRLRMKLKKKELKIFLIQNLTFFLKVLKVLMWTIFLNVER